MSDTEGPIVKAAAMQDAGEAGEEKLGERGGKKQLEYALRYRRNERSLSERRITTMYPRDTGLDISSFCLIDRLGRHFVVQLSKRFFSPAKPLQFLSQLPRLFCFDQSRDWRVGVRVCALSPSPSGRRRDEQPIIRPEISLLPSDTLHECQTRLVAVLRVLEVALAPVRVLDIDHLRIPIRRFDVEDEAKLFREQFLLKPVRQIPC